MPGEMMALPREMGMLPPVSLAPFISKLCEILSTSTPDDSIKWGPMGDTIIVTDQVKFAREVLPRYFKHDNIRSFIRQLNIYGFQRCRNPERTGSVEGEHGELEFYHEHFLEGRTDLMRQITRGMPSNKRRRSGLTASDGAIMHHMPPSPMPPTHMSGAPVGMSADAQHLASEMNWVQQHIANVDTQLRQQAHHVQSRMASLVEALATTPAPPPPPLANGHPSYPGLAQPHPAAWGAALPHHDVSAGPVSVIPPANLAVAPPNAAEGGALCAANGAVHPSAPGSLNAAAIPSAAAWSDARAAAAANGGVERAAAADAAAANGCCFSVPAASAPVHIAGELQMNAQAATA